MVTVKLNDGMVKVGGEFNSALSRIKGFAGRSYESASKTWTVPTTVKDFVNRIGLPVDIESGPATGARTTAGNHVTRYGNTYTRNEWDASKEVSKAEYDARNQVADKYAAVDRWLNEELGKVIAPEHVGKIAGMIKGFGFDDAVEYGRIQFSTEAKKQAVLAIAKEYFDRNYVVIQEEEEIAEVAAEQIRQKYGIE